MLILRFAFCTLFYTGLTSSIVALRAIVRPVAVASIVASGLAAPAANLCHVLAVAADSFSTPAAYSGHMLAVAADSFSTLTGYFSLLLGVHRGKATLTVSGFFICHVLFSC